MTWTTAIDDAMLRQATESSSKDAEDRYIMMNGDARGRVYAAVRVRSHSTRRLGGHFYVCAVSKAASKDRNRRSLCRLDFT